MLECPAEGTVSGTSRSDGEQDLGGATLVHGLVAFRGRRGQELREIAEPEIAAARPGSTTCSTRSSPPIGQSHGRERARYRCPAAGHPNPGCQMQVAFALRRTAARDIGLAHTVEVVDASMRGLPVDSLRR
jgi:glycolate oxidase iron-sulfur subunit